MASGDSALANRFEKMRQATTEAVDMNKLKVMPFSELQELTIKFGDAKRGQPYHQVVQEDPRYCKWFLSNYGNSQKGTHQEFAFYLRAYTEKMENMEKITGGKKDLKSKAPGKGASSKENPKTPSLSEEEDWDPIEGGVPRDLETHFRINQLEQMMQQMVIQVQGLTQAVQQGMKPSEQ